MPFKFIYKAFRKILYKPVNLIKEKISNIFRKFNSKKQNLTKKLQIKLKNNKEKFEKTKNIVKN